MNKLLQLINSKLVNNEMELKVSELAKEMGCNTTDIWQELDKLCKLNIIGIGYESGVCKLKKIDERV